MAERDYNHAYWLQHAIEDTPNYEYWIGCEYPEKPYDEHVLYIPQCGNCLLHAKAAIETGLFSQKLSPFGSSLEKWIKDEEEGKHKMEGM